MLNSDKNSETAKNYFVTAGVMAAVGGAATAAFRLDQYYGGRGIPEMPSTEPELFFQPRQDADKTLVLLGGFCMGTKGVAKRFNSQLADDVNLIAPIAPDVGFNPQTMFESTYRALEKTNTSKLYVAGLSMGGRLAIDFVNHGFRTGRQDFFKDYSMAFRGSPMDKHCVRVMPRLLLDTIGLLGYSYTLDHARPILRRFSAKSAATAPITRVVEEGNYLLSDFDRTLPVRPKRVIWVRGMKPDPTINEDRSISLLQKDIGMAIEQYFDKDCTEPKHMPTNKRAAQFMLSKFDLVKPDNSPLDSVPATLTRAA